MGLFDRSSTTQKTLNQAMTTEVGLSESPQSIGNISGGNVVYTDQNAVKLANELAGTSVNAVQSVASQALDFNQKVVADTYKANGQANEAALLAIGAANEQANNLAQAALYRVAEAKNPNATPPPTINSTNVGNLIKYVAIVAGLFLVVTYFKGKR